MHNFFIENTEPKEEIQIKGSDVNHIKNVLRLKPGDKICVHVKEVNDKYICEISKFFENAVSCKICEKLTESKESNIYINIVQALPKSDKMELIIQKCTELGVSEFTPLSLSRCIVKLSGKDAIKKVERWQSIAEVASKQCTRDIVPKVNEIQTLKTLPSVLEGYDTVIVAYENEKATMLKSIIQSKPQKVAIIIGPEGGIDISEVEVMQNYGYKIVSLGKRILRTETVGIALSSIIMYENGDLG